MLELLYGPLPLTVSAAIAVLCVLGYIHFVLPRMERADRLEERNEELETLIKDHVQYGTARTLKDLLDLLKVLETGQTDILHGLKDRSVPDLARLMEEQSKVLKLVDNIHQDLEQLSEKTDDMHQKQSTFLGVLMGAGLIKSGFNAKGIK